MQAVPISAPAEKSAKPHTTLHQKRLLRKARVIACGCLIMAFLSACNSPPKGSFETELKPNPTSRPQACKDDISPADNVVLTSIAQATREDKAYAALAQLDALQLQTPRAQLLRADALRKVDRSNEARNLYLSLLESCVRGQAHHGMGLLLASLHDDTNSLKHLQMARVLMPTEAQVRNDLGYALLLRRELVGARYEFMTAIELAPEFAKPKHNLYMTATLLNDEALQQSIARQGGFNASAEARLQESARQLPRVDAPLPSRAGANTP
jgi:Flp pilus assembly protein TadD